MLVYCRTLFSCAPEVGAAPSLIRRYEEAAVDKQLDGDDGHPPGAPIDEGGDSACWTHLVCPSCGMMVASGHQRGCERAIAR
jgi:hypothetical protein